MMVPDKVDPSALNTSPRLGIYATTIFAFFLAEFGDKTQIATVALAARYHDLLPVVAGTTIGMMLADIPAVLLGDAMTKKVSATLVHGIAAAVFATLGVLALFNVGGVFS